MRARLSASISLSLVSAVVGCGSARDLPSSDSSGDAGVPGSAPLSRAFARDAPGDGRAIVSALRAHAGIASGLARDGLAVAEPQGFHFATRAARSPFRAASDALRVVAPARADAPLTLQDPIDPGVALEVRAEGLTSAAGVAVDAAVVYADAAPSTDLVHVLLQGRVEELRVLRDASAAPHARYRLRLGPALVSVRANGARIEVLDAAGAVRLATEPWIAFDAHGISRTPALRVGRDGDAWTVDASLDVAGLAFPIAIDPLWHNALSAKYDHYAHTANMMGGSVHLIGGQTITAASATVYSNVLKYTDAGLANGATDMLAPRLLHATTNLSFQLLVTGGIKPLASGNSQYLGTAELCDGGTNCIATASMATARATHSATALPDGRVLVAGGMFVDAASMAHYVSTAEIYDPVTKAWSAAGAMKTPRGRHAAVPVAGGVLMIGGETTMGATVSTVELWTSTGFVDMPPLRAPGAYFAAAAIAKGKYAGQVLVTGGQLPSTTSDVERFDPVAQTWTQVAPMASRRYAHTLNVLPNGRLLVVGGNDVGTAMHSTAELYDPDADAWSAAGSLSQPRQAHTATNLEQYAGDVRVMIAGGLGDAYSIPLPLEVYDPAPNGNMCAFDGDCATGHCVDGYCCDGACSGQCEACDVPGSVGTCAPVKGAPHNTRLACDDGTTDLCKASVCDGKARAACTISAGATVECRPASCAGSIFTTRAACDGKGACPTLATTECAPYSCSPMGCFVTCASSEQCANGYTCRTGACVPSAGTTCDPDGLRKIAKDGTITDCAPFRCNTTSGDCAASCSKTDECAPGYACADPKCVAAGDSGGASAGGCATAGAGAERADGDAGGAAVARGAAMALGLLLAGLIRRRRA
jgi:hypothetical protein